MALERRRERAFGLLTLQLTHQDHGTDFTRVYRAGGHSTSQCSHNQADAGRERSLWQEAVTSQQCPELAYAC
jgi:hypothetical protein